MIACPQCFLHPFPASVPAMTNDAHLPPLLRAALRRRPRRAPKKGKGGEKSGNNYLAEAPKKRAGARPGNTNALRHGLYARESRARRAALNALVAEAMRLADLFGAAP